MIQTHEFDGFTLYSLNGVCHEGTQIVSKTEFNTITRKYETKRYYSAKIVTPTGEAFVLDQAFGGGYNAGDIATVVYEDHSTPLAVWKKGERGYSIHAKLKAHEPDARRNTGITAGAIFLFMAGLIPALLIILTLMPVIMPVLEFLGFSSKSITIIIGIMICALSAYGTYLIGGKILAKDASYSESRSKAIQQVWDRLSRSEKNHGKH